MLSLCMYVNIINVADILIYKGIKYLFIEKFVVIIMNNWLFVVDLYIYCNFY